MNYSIEKTPLRTCIGVVVSVVARKYVRTLYQLLNVSFRTISSSVGTSEENEKNVHKN